MIWRWKFETKKKAQELKSIMEGNRSLKLKNKKCEAFPGEVSSSYRIETGFGDKA